MNRYNEMRETKERLEKELMRINNQMEAIQDNDIPRMITIREASREAGLSYNHIRALCRSGKIVSIRAGNRTLINREKLIAYLNSGKEERHDS